MKFALDTNVFVDAIRDPGAASAFETFLVRALPFTYLSAVVAQELRAGARTQAQAVALQRGLLDPFVRRGRVFSPSTSAFIESGRILAAIQEPSLANDALLAASCREQGITLITNDRDFRRIARFLGNWEPVRPWPTLIRARP